jgi:hypothetical protein
MMMMNDAPVNGLLLNGFIFFNEKMYKNHHKVAQKKLDAFKLQPIDDSTIP